MEHKGMGAHIAENRRVVWCGVEYFDLSENNQFQWVYLKRMDERDI
jgi:hypothetical protein